MKYTENEKNIIKDLKQLCYEVSREDNLFNYDNYSPSEIMTMVDNVLNLVKKLQNEIERLYKDNYRLDRENQLKFEKAVDTSDYIPKIKIEELFADLEDYFDRPCIPDEDLEYLRNMKSKILGE